MPQGFEATESNERFHEASVKFIELVERGLGLEVDETMSSDEAYKALKKRYEVEPGLARELSGAAPTNPQITAVELSHEYETPFDGSEIYPTHDATHHYSITLWQKGGYLTGSRYSSGDSLPHIVAVRLNKDTGGLSADYAGGRNFEQSDFLEGREEDAELISLFCQTAEMIIDQQAE